MKPPELKFRISGLANMQRFLIETPIIYCRFSQSSQSQILEGSRKILLKQEDETQKSKQLKRLNLAILP